MCFIITHEVSYITTNAKGNYMSGLIWNSWETIESSLIETPSTFGYSLPSAVDLTSIFPVPGNKDNQKSCVPLAVAYVLKSHQEEIHREWGLNI